ncbi:MAG: DMT family transporter [Acidimicrobiia bacterium]
MPSPGRRGSLLVLAAAMLWGTTGTAQALGPSSSNPLAVGAIRMVVGGVALVLLATAKGAVAHWPEWRRGSVMVAGVAMAAYQPLFFAGVLRAGVAVGTMIAIGSAPVLAALLARWIRREPLSRRWAIATVVAVAGLVLLASSGESAGIEASGVILALGAGACYAVYAVAAKGIVGRHPTVPAMALVFGWAAALSIPVLLLADRSWLRELSGVAMTLYLGLVTTTLAYLLFAGGLRVTQVGTAATLTLGEPGTAAALAVLVLGESLSPAAGIGLVLIASALLVLARHQASVPRYPAPGAS